MMLGDYTERILNHISNRLVVAIWKCSVFIFMHVFCGGKLCVVIIKL